VKPGLVIATVNGEDVLLSSHQYVADALRMAGKNIRLGCVPHASVVLLNKSATASPNKHNAPAEAPPVQPPAAPAAPGSPVREPSAIPSSLSRLPSPSRSEINVTDFTEGFEGSPGGFVGNQQQHAEMEEKQLREVGSYQNGGMGGDGLASADVQNKSLNKLINTLFEDPRTAGGGGGGGGGHGGGGNTINNAKEVETDDGYILPVGAHAIRPKAGSDSRLVVAEKAAEAVVSEKMSVLRNLANLAAVPPRLAEVSQPPASTGRSSPSLQKRTSPVKSVTVPKRRTKPLLLTSTVQSPISTEESAPTQPTHSPNGEKLKPLTPKELKEQERVRKAGIATKAANAAAQSRRARLKDKNRPQPAWRQQLDASLNKEKQRRREQKMIQDLANEELAVQGAAAQRRKEEGDKKRSESKSSAHIVQSFEADSRVLSYDAQFAAMDWGSSAVMTTNPAASNTKQRSSVMEWGQKASYKQNNSSSKRGHKSDSSYSPSTRVSPTIPLGTGGHATNIFGDTRRPAAYAGEEWVNSRAGKCPF
jgi:hypothetical protein